MEAEVFGKGNSRLPARAPRPLREYMKNEQNLKQFDSKREQCECGYSALTRAIS